MASKRRLLDLPEDIYLRIINQFLSDPTTTNRAAIRISLVSKKFLAAVQKRPVLVYDDDDEHELRHMLSTLTRYHTENIHLDTLRFTCRIDADRIMNIIDQSIELASANNLGLKNLNICMECVLPKPVFEAESLVQLELKWCSLLLPGESMIRWPNLKTLRLCLVDMEEGVFESIIRGCPLIEFLEIHYCNYDFKVANLVCLKKLVIRLNEDHTFELGAAPNLEWFECGAGDLRLLGKYKYHKLKNMVLLSGLQALFDGDFLINLAHQFPVLEDLYIGWIKLEKISISSPSLKNIEIKYISGLREARFDVPNVVLFKFNSGPTLTFADNPRGWNSSIILVIYSDSRDKFLKLKEFSAALNQTEALVFVPFGKMNFSIQAPGIIRDLTISELRKEFSLPRAREILDAILLILRPLRIKIKDSCDCEFTKFLYDHLLFENANSVTRIGVNRYWTKLVEGGSTVNGSWHQVLEQPQVLDRVRFMEMFRVDDDDDDDDDDRNNKFNSEWELAPGFGALHQIHGHVQS